jgi:hypothetical protein
MDGLMDIGVIINSPVMNEVEFKTIILKYEQGGEKTINEKEEEIKKWIKISYPDIDYYDQKTGTTENSNERKIKTIKEELLILQAAGIGIGLCIIVWSDSELKKEKTKKFAQILNARGFKRKKYDKIRKNFNLRMIIFEWIIGIMVIAGYYLIQLNQYGSKYIMLSTDFIRLIVFSYTIMLIAPIIVNRGLKN